jgi:hypothetical protein
MCSITLYYKLISIFVVYCGYRRFRMSSLTKIVGRVTLLRSTSMSIVSRHRNIIIQAIEFGAYKFVACSGKSNNVEDK